jgi:excisionase family DNA binding protein
MNRTDTNSAAGASASSSGQERVLLTVEEAARRLRIGRTTAYRLVAEGQLASIQIGHLRRIPVDAVAAFVQDRRAATT